MSIKTRKQLKAKIIKYLEHDCAFRDYRILPAKYFRQVGKVGIHHLFSMDSKEGKASVEYEIDDAISTFCRDGFPCIYFYI